MHPYSILRDRVFAITGASRGIGAASTSRLVEAGACVGAIAREAKSDSDRVLALDADVRDSIALNAAIDRIVAWRGRLDGVVANAATIERGDFAAIEPARIEELVETNVTGALLTVRHALPHLQSGARIVIVGSFAGRRGTPGLAAYSATKGALLAFSMALRAELEPRGITVSYVAPGPTRTRLRGEDRGGVDPSCSAESILRALRDGAPYVEATRFWRLKSWFETIAPRIYDSWIRGAETRDEGFRRP